MLPCCEVRDPPTAVSRLPGPLPPSLPLCCCCCRFGIREKDVMVGMYAPSTGKIDDRWRAFMQFQIGRARDCFADAENGVDFLDGKARWPVW